MVVVEHKLLLQEAYWVAKVETCAALAYASVAVAENDVFAAAVAAAVEVYEVESVAAVLAHLLDLEASFQAYKGLAALVAAAGRIAEGLAAAADLFAGQASLHNLAA